MPKKLWASVDTPQKIVERRAQDAERTEKPNGWLRLVLARPLLTLVTGTLALLAVAAPHVSDAPGPAGRLQLSLR